MLTFIISILGIILTIFFVVGVHEFGHFIVARLMGVKVLRFSIGFGKSLFRWHDKKGTEYVLAAIPLGGYVKMLDEQESAVAKKDLPFAYNRQPLYKRFAIVSAGVIFNIIFSFAIYWLLFVIGFTTFTPIVGKVSPDSIAQAAGIRSSQEIMSINDQPTPTWMKVIVGILNQAGEKGTMKVAVKEPATQTIRPLTLNLATWKLDNLRPEPLASLGIFPYEPEIPTIIGEIQSSSNAYNKLLKGDKIIAVDRVPVKDWSELVAIIIKKPSQQVSFTINRQGKLITIPIKVGYKLDVFLHQQGFLGISPQFEWPKALLRTQHYGPLAAIAPAWQETKMLLNLNVIVLKKLFTGEVSIRSLGGPITIFESAGAALNHGFVAFLSFLAFLSVAIAVINILPIPGLDGGHVLFQAIEFMTRHPVSVQIQLLLYRLGLVLLLLLIAQSFVNDLWRL